MTGTRQVVAYVDVDDTLVRSFGSKTYPMTEMVCHIQDLNRDGVILCAWSSGGGEYARESAKELNIENCFKAFLPKPNVIIDDQSLADWRRLIHVHPGEAASKTAGEYADAVYGTAG
jgi:hypothetical protein